MFDGWFTPTAFRLDAPRQNRGKTMSMYKWRIDYFSGDVIDLPKKERLPDNVLRVLAKNPMVSCFDMSEHYRWLPGITDLLVEKGWVKDERDTVGYPWLKFTVTEAGKEHLKMGSQR